MKLNRYDWTKHLDFIVLDSVCIMISYFISIYLRHHTLDLVSDSLLYKNIGMVLFAATFGYEIFKNTQHNILHRGLLVEFESTLKTNAVIWVIAVAYMFIIQQSSVFSRWVLLVGFFISIVLMFIGRIVWKSIVITHLSKSNNLSNILIISTKDRVEELTKNYLNMNLRTMIIKGIVLVDGNDDIKSINGIPVVSDKEHFSQYIIEHVVDEVLVSLNYTYQEREDIIRSLVNAGVKVHVHLAYLYNDLPNISLENMGGYVSIHSSVTNITQFDLFVKRVIDIVGAIVGLFITGIALIIVGPLIYKASPGNIIFSQERVGRNGRRFKIYKLRSMYLDAEERKKELMAQNKMDGAMFKVDDDPRIIKGIGHFIRKTSLDELPQFYNVLKGDMSLVGTRPPLVDEVSEYDLHHKIRLSMKPGITGLWQVSGRSDITDFENVVNLDVNYIENWSFRQDLRIILRTVLLVFTGRGAE